MKIIDTDVLVVGAGPAGLAAAIELRKRDIDRVLVIDREKEAGGIPRYCHHIGFGIRDMRRILTGPSYAARYVRQAKEHGVDIHTQTTITGWDDTTYLTATHPDGLIKFRAEAVVLATGCRERPRSARLIPGSRPGGVFTTGSLQRFVYEHQYLVGKRAIVVGADHVGFSSILTLKHAGLDVKAMVTEYPRHQSFFIYKLISADRYRVPIYSNTKVTNILGKKRVEAVELTDTRDGGIRQVACDTVVFTGDWIPDYELSHDGGLQIDPLSRSPLVDLNLHTSRKGVFAAGNLIHAAETADVAALSGRYAARRVVEYLLSEQSATIQQTIPIELNEPLEWVSPHLVRTGQRQAPMGRFTLRVSRFMKKSMLEVWQADRRLYGRRFYRLTPHLPMYLTDKWLHQVCDTGEPIRVMLC